MGHASKLLAAALAAFAAAPLASPSFAAPADGPIIMLDYHRVDETPEGYGKALVDRMRAAAEWAVPKDRASKTFDCSVEFSKDNDSPRFSAFTVKGRSVRIVIGGPLETLPADTETLNRVMATLLLARAGFMAESVETGYPEWLSAGLIRKAVTDMALANSPGGAGFPGALALASSGRLPDLKAVVSGPLSPSDGACYEIYSEYCQMLVAACARAGMVQSGVFRTVVRDAATKSGPERYRSFLNASAANLAPKPKGVAAASAGAAHKDKEAKAAKRDEADVAATASRWFKGEIEKMLCNCFTPASAKCVEASFKAASRTSYADKDGVAQICELDELCKRWNSIGDARLVVAGARERLAEMSASAPDDIQQSIYGLQTALNGLLASGAKPKDDALAPALEAFYSALEARIAFEARLKRSELGFYPPCSRFAYSLRRLAAYDAWEEEPFAKEAAWLDACLAKAGK